MILNRFLLILLTTCLVIPLDGIAQSTPDQFKIKSIGIPFMETYGLSDYSTTTVSYGAQNYDVLIGDDEKVYFANIEGLLIFDGVNWTRLRLPDRAICHSLTKARDGTIYIGALNEIGYLSSTQNGELKYNSLKPALSAATEDNFTAFFSFMLNDEVVFSDNHQLIIFNPQTKTMRAIKSPYQLTPIQSASQANLYSYQNDSLYRLEGDQWQAMKRSKLRVATNTSRILPVAISDRKTIVVTNDGFFDFETEESINIHPDVMGFLSRSKLTQVQLIEGKYLSISTNNGLLITDLAGNPVQYLNEQKGLSNNLVQNTTLDRTGLLWVATNFGITKVELVSPYSIFDKRAGLSGNVSFVQELDGYIYLATASGTLRQKWSRLQNPLQDDNFEKLDEKESRYLIKTDDALVSLANNIPLTLESGISQQIKGSFKNYYWTGFKFRGSNDMLVGSRQGKLLHLRKNSGNWEIKEDLTVSVPDILFMAQGEGEHVWITNRSGVVKLEYDLENSSIISSKTYGKTDGLPYATDNYVFDIGSKPSFSTFGGIYRYDADMDRFVPDERFTTSLGSQPVLRLDEDKNGNLYCIGDGYLVLKKSPSGYKMSRLINEKLINYNPFNIHALDSANVFLPTFSAFIHVDPTIPLALESFDAKITSIKGLDQKDTTYYAGFGELANSLKLPEKSDALRIAFTSTFYQNIDRITYKWRIQEIDQTWSNWSSETKKDYTNLPYGTYTFEVAARNIHFIESRPAKFCFTVLPPWYFTWWAYLLYATSLVFLVWAIVKIYTRKIRADRDRLEAIVVNRTKEISLQKEQVEKDAAIISDQHQKLVKMDDLKKRFFVNISHELRTPLTLSMGTVNQALKGNYGELNDELYANLQVSKRNSERLLKMVTSILDISKLEGGKIQLYTSSADPLAIVQKVLAFFSSRLVDKQITLKEDLISGIEVYLDQDKFETVLINLLSNAFKFTPHGGEIQVAMKNHPSELVLVIKDNGEGIPESDLNLVFDRFYQSPTIKSGEGIGVGLALTKELVELHHGSIAVENDHGAAFTLTFPKGKDHLTPNQIIDPSEVTETGDLSDKYLLCDDQDIAVVPEKESTTHLEHILLVEDNSEMRQFISGILKPYYQVSWAEDGTKGLEFLQEHKPDLIITDYLMPNMDGYEMVMEIKKSEQLAFIPIVFLTARAREQDKINVLNLGVDDYLYKPFSTDELLIRIKNLLFNKKHRAEYIEEQEIDSFEIEWKEFDSKLKMQIDAFIKENIKVEISGEDLAQTTGQSERSLYRKVKLNTGLSLMQYVKEYRLRQARNLLENKELLTVSEVSYAVGFNYLSHFTKSYKERFGKAPSEYLE